MATTVHESLVIWGLCVWAPALHRGFVAWPSDLHAGSVNDVSVVHFGSGQHGWYFSGVFRESDGGAGCQPR